MRGRGTADAKPITEAVNEFARVFDSLDKVVFSTTLKHVEGNNTRIVRANAVEEVLALRQQHGLRLDPFRLESFKSGVVALHYRKHTQKRGEVNMFKRVFTVIAFLVSLPLSCADFGVEPTASGIVWNRSIDRVTIGDDSLTVIRKLGRPNAISTDNFPGHVFVYTSGAHAGLTVSICTAAGILALGAQAITIRAPYSGATGEGIGIGSSREELRRAFGVPLQSGDSWDDYQEGSCRTIVRYDSNMVSSLSIMCPVAQ